jgi:hypothetical protein
MTKSSSRRRRQRTQRIRAAINALELICPGSLHTRTKTCGQPACRCATDEGARHGPYHEWTRYVDGRLVHRTVTAEQARIIIRAIADYRKAEGLLARWVEESVAEILDTRPEA